MRRAPLAVSAEIRALLGSVLLLSCASVSLRAETVEYNIENATSDFDTTSKTLWKTYVAAFAGYNMLIDGYEGYKNLGNAGVELWLQPYDVSIEEPTWRTNRFYFRLSAEWMPLQVPAGNYGITEDIYAGTAQIIYRFRMEDRGEWSPFIGFGAGQYIDRITLDTPASGKVSGNHSHFGMNGSAGIFLPPVGPFRLAAEARYHRLRGPDGFWPQNVTFHGNLIYEL